MVLGNIVNKNIEKSLLEKGTFINNIYNQDVFFLSKIPVEFDFLIFSNEGILEGNNMTEKDIPLKFLQIDNINFDDYQGYKYLYLKNKSITNEYIIVVRQENQTMYSIIIFIVLSFPIILFIIFLLYRNNKTYVEDHLIIPINSIINFSKNFRREDIVERLDSDTEIVEVQELYEKFNFLLEKMQESFDKVEDFSTNVSHELRTPITSMKQSIEVELTKDRSKEEYIELLIKILDDVNWINSIINDMLLLARLSSSREFMNWEDINIKEVIEEICEIMEFSLEDSNIKLEYSSIDNINIVCDKGKIKRLLINLITNAIKYNKDNGHIYIYTDIVSDRIIISIRDTGIGIKKDNINKITEKFFREDKVRTSKKSGVGLGLSICNHIINLHNGKFSIESEEGIGSTFKVILPIKGGKSGLL